MEKSLLLTNLTPERKTISRTSSNIVEESIDKTLVDGLIVISNEITISRIMEIQELSAIIGYKSSIMDNIIIYTGKELGSFSEFLTEIDILREGCEVLNSGVTEFNDMYYKAYRFMYPFITKNYKKHDYTWDGKNWV